MPSENKLSHASSDGPPVHAGTLADPVAGSSAIDLRQLIPPGASAVAIEHQGQRYTLRVTRANKLILTK